MANVNYYVNSNNYTVNSNETWGEQDINNDSTEDQGDIPMVMRIYANPDYNVDASYFTIKGYEPTFTGIIDGVEIREWVQGLDTVHIDSVTGTQTSVENIQLGGEFTADVNKVHIYNIGGYQDNVLMPAYLNPQNLNGGVSTGSDATLMIDLESSEILLDGSPIPTGSIVGVFGENNGTYTCYGFTVWDDNSMPPAAITVLGDVGGGFGFTPGEEIHIFIKDGVTDIIYKTEVTWNTATIPFTWTDGAADGYVDGGLYQILSTENTPFVSSDVTVDYVVVKAWLNPTYNIIGSNDIQLYLDIDGDAQPNDNTSEQLESQFYITVKLKDGENSNSIIEANTSYYGDSISDSSIPNWFVESVNVDDHTAKVLFTKNPYYTTPQPLDFGQLVAFIIKPKNSSYTVCKDNFFIETASELIPGWNYGNTWFDENYVDITDNVFINNAWGTGTSTALPNIYGSNNSGINESSSSPYYFLSYTYGVYEFEDYADTGASSGGWYEDKVKNVQVGFDDGNSVDYINLNSLLNQQDNPGGTFDTMFGCGLSMRNGFLIQEQNNIISSDEYNDILEEAESWTYDPNPVSDYLNAIDWSKNIVIISLGRGQSAQQGGFQFYYPEDNLQTGTNIPKNLIFEIEGSAMEIQTSDMPSAFFNGLITEEID